jgi:hypothetical protein
VLFFAHSSGKYRPKVCVLDLFGGFQIYYFLHLGLFNLQKAPFRLSSLLDSLSFFNPGNVVLAAKYHHFSTFCTLNTSFFYHLFVLMLTLGA